MPDASFDSGDEHDTSFIFADEGVFAGETVAVQRADRAFPLLPGREQAPE